MSPQMFLLPYAVLSFQLVFVAPFPSTSLVLNPKFRASKALQGIFNYKDPLTFFLRRSTLPQATQVPVDQATQLDDYDINNNNINNNNNNNNGGRGRSGGGGRGDPPQNGNNNNKRDDDENDEWDYWFTSSALAASAVVDDTSMQGKTTRNQTLPQRVAQRVSRALVELEYLVRHVILRQPTEEERAYQRLRSTIVRYVICNSTLLPNTIVQQCAKRGRMIGSPLLAETVQETARWINQWYQREGYALSCVTGATLMDEETGTVELVVEEPKFANPCVAIAYARPIPTTGNSNSHSNISTSSSSNDMQSTTTPTATNENATATSSVSYRISTTEGRTNPMVIQRALGFIPGAPYRWKEREWREISSSIRTVFSSMFHAEPHRLDDGTVQFRIIAEERNAGNFAYGVTKSLMKVSSTSESSNNPASNLEGELSFDYANVFGGGETVSFSVRRAAKDPEASYRFSYSDEEFCTSTNHKHGWRIEGFNQYVGKGDDLVVTTTTTHRTSTTNRVSPKMDHDESIRSDDTIMNPSTDKRTPEEVGVISTTTISPSGESINFDSEVIRKGASFMVQNPLSSFGIPKSITEISAERLISTSGKSENIVSTNLGLGPFVRSLPREGRHSIMFAVGVGSRLGGILWGEPKRIAAPNSNNVGDMVDRTHAPTASAATSTTTTSLSLPFRVFGSIPFTHASATVREVFPFSTVSLVGSSSSSRTKDRSITLALRHTVSACTDTIPTTKAMAHAAAHKVRGYSASSTRGDPSSSKDGDPNRPVEPPAPIFHGYQGMLMGTTEVRIPITLPTNRFTQDASIVVFGDWLFAKELDTDGGNTSNPGTTTTSLLPQFVRPSRVTRKSSVGIGLRKSIQGFPLQYDISLTEQGRIGAFLNFGRDFDVY